MQDETPEPETQPDLEPKGRAPNDVDDVDVFISHASVDETWASRLAKRLEEETIDGRPLRAYFAPWDIEPGTNFVDALNEALESARFVLVVLTEQALASEWVLREWTAGVLKDPSGRRGRVIPVLREDCELPILLSGLQYVDFREEEAFEENVAQLLDRFQDADGSDRARGPRGQARASVHPSENVRAAIGADEIQETVESNLLPVERLPPRWFEAPTSYTDTVEVLEAVGYDAPPFILWDGKLITSENLSAIDATFRPVVETDAVASIELSRVLADEELHRRLMQLLNKAVQVELRSKGVGYDREHDRFVFLPPREGTTRKETWVTPTGREVERTVAKAITGAAGSVLRWRHLAASIEFRELGPGLVLQIDPTWTFTEDGKEALAWKENSRYVTQLTSKERNPAVVNHVRFWASVLAEDGDRIVLPTGGYGIRVATEPMSTVLNRGVRHDDSVPALASLPSDAAGAIGPATIEQEGA